jgi:hypothetical protein
VGGLYLVGDPDAIAGGGVLHADGELIIPNEKRAENRAFCLHSPQSDQA